MSIDDNLWRELALTLGYNRSEAETKFSAQLEPLQEMLADFMSRDGSPDEFMNAMYKVARTFKLIPVDEMRENVHNQRLERSRTPSKCLLMKTLSCHLNSKNKMYNPLLKDLMKFSSIKFIL